MEAQEKQIGPHRYRVHPLGFKAGRKALLRFSKVAGPALTEIARAGLAQGAKVLDADVLPAFATLIDRLTDADLDYFEEVFTPKTEVFVEGGEGWQLLADVKEVLWAQRYGDFLAWLLFCAEVNFGGFFAEARERAAKAKAEATQSTS